MDGAFRRGYLETELTPAPFVSPIRLLAGSIRLWAAKLRFIAGVTLLVYLPGYLLFQLAAYLLNLPSDGLPSLFLLEALDLVLAALVMPAAVYGLVRKSDTSVADALRWGRRQWLRTLGNQVKVEITVMLYGALLIVPGIVAMVRLTFVPIIIAIEADRQSQPLVRSRSLAAGNFWRMLIVLLPVSIAGMGGSFLLLGHIPKVDEARIFFAIAQSLLAVVDQLGTVAALLMYLGIAPPAQRVQKKTAKL